MDDGSDPLVCLVGTAPPRRCGIATFTDDLLHALTGAAPDRAAVQVALTDEGGSYDYGPDVVFEVRADALQDYRDAAAFVNSGDVDVLCVQHEFGIFGGVAGAHLDELLEHVRTPVVTTLHTVLADTSPTLRAATRRVAERSDVLVVLAEQAVDLLEAGCGIDRDQVRVIPHGVPVGPDLDQAVAKESIVATGRTVLLTFGLLSPGKGVEVVIEALPTIVAAHPDVLYVVLGATHPHVLRDHGDAYRDGLHALAERLGVAAHVRFVDRFVDLDELRRHLAASDLYITPYHGADQIVSGTLAYAVGSGCAVVSTPYPYARELLADGRGELVPFRDPGAMATILTDLLADGARRDQMRERARVHGRSMTWPAVGRAYQALFAEVVARHEARPVAVVERPVPTPSFAHLRALTDDVGVFQHAPHGVPERAHGYCTDDVGRALLVAVLGAARGDQQAAGLVPGYLSFLRDAQQTDGRFDNLMGFDRRFLRDTASQDTLGQAVWGLGVAVAQAAEVDWSTLAGEVLVRAVPATADLHATKAVAYAMNGLAAYLSRFPGAQTPRRVLRLLAERQVHRLEATARGDWLWFDDALTYGNAAVPGALLVAGRALEEPAWVAAGTATLDFLLERTLKDGRFEPVGNDGWWPRDGVKAVYGQQPVEAGLTVQACVSAHEITGQTRYLDAAQAAVAWLLGRNRLGVALYDPTTGRCADGLDRHGASRNAGAESTICALLALLALPAAP